MADTTGLNETDVRTLRDLGAWAAAASASPANQERVQAWYKHDAGAPDRRVMVLAEMNYLTGDKQRQPVAQGELRCTDPWARQLEYHFRLRRFEVEVVRDDHVVPPFVEILQPWGSDFEVPINHRRPAPTRSRSTTSRRSGSSTTRTSRASATAPSAGTVTRRNGPGNAWRPSSPASCRCAAAAGPGSSGYPSPAWPWISSASTTS